MASPAHQIISAMSRLGYRVDRDPGELNLLYMEGANADFTPNGNAPNRFNDRRVLIRFEGGEPRIVGNWEATSEPGKWFTDKQLNPRGAARIKLGQWKAWRVGIHPRSNPARGHEGLLQDLPVTVCRDGNRDYSRAGDFEDTGLHGINHHWGYDNPTADIKTASAGCLVGRETAGHREFMALLKSDPRYQADKSFVFTATIMTVADLDGILAPAQVPTTTEGKTMKLTWLASVLRDAGLKVIEQPGWQTRGHGDMGVVRGVLCHHTAGALTGNAPSLKVVQNGRPDLAGPLSQLVLARDGTYYVVAAGLCYHAGAGEWQGLTTGNASLIGIEAENTGLPNDFPWPEVQMEAYRIGAAALMLKLRAPIIMCAGHKEYALPRGRKPDPSFDMVAFRADVAKLMGAPASAAPAPAPAQPAAQPAAVFEQKAPKIMADLMKDFGLTDVQAAGVLGNIGHECGGFRLMQEQSPSSGIGGYGWAQWTGVRRTAFFNWCQQNNLSVDSDAGNYGFLKHELKTTEAGAIRAVKATTTMDNAMREFERTFERSGIKHYDSRLAYAQRALNAHRSRVAVSPTEDRVKTTGGFVIGSTTAGGVATGVEQGWGLIEWAIFTVVIFVICGILYGAYRWWKSRKVIEIPYIVPVAEPMVESSVLIGDFTVDTVEMTPLTSVASMFDEVENQILTPSSAPVAAAPAPLKKKSAKKAVKKRAAKKKARR